MSSESTPTKFFVVFPGMPPQKRSINRRPGKLWLEQDSAGDSNVDLAQFMAGTEISKKFGLANSKLTGD